MASCKLTIAVFLFLSISEMIYGNNIAETLMGHFNAVKSECSDQNGHKRPAYECSGLMIRGLANIGGPNTEQKYAWSKKESNRESGTFSFSFLRKDQLFERVNYDSGLIIFPHLKTPHGKKKFDVFCAFPVNAFTIGRGGDHGCGRSQSDKLLGYSDFCHTQGIITLSKWIDHYEQILQYIKNNSIMHHLMALQCGFDMTSEEKATEQFALAIEAKKYLQEYNEFYSFCYNELRIQAWDEDKPEEIPIEAFFYIINPEEEEKERKGIDEAIMYQRHYLDLTGETVPIVGIGLPQKDSPNPHLTVIELKVQIQ